MPWVRGEAKQHRALDAGLHCMCARCICAKGEPVDQDPCRICSGGKEVKGITRVPRGGGGFSGEGFGASPCY